MKTYKSKWFGEIVYNQPEMVKVYERADKEQDDHQHLAPFKPGDIVKATKQAWDTAPPTSEEMAKKYIHGCKVKHCFYMGEDTDGPLWCVDIIDLPYLYSEKDFEKL